VTVYAIFEIFGKKSESNVHKLQRTPTRLFILNLFGSFQYLQTSAAIETSEVPIGLIFDRRQQHGGAACLMWFADLSSLMFYITSFFVKFQERLDQCCYFCINYYFYYGAQSFSKADSCSFGQELTRFVMNKNFHYQTSQVHAPCTRPEPDEPTP
jgi:hypothetical protein